MKRRFALVGAGGRGISFVEAIVTKYAADNELVALCDLSPTRRDYYNEVIVSRWHAQPAATYEAEDYAAMLAEQRPDVVIVCTPDATHSKFIIGALDAGVDVITEKPMTTDPEQCRRIFDAVARSGRSLRVAFNYRWGPFRTKLKEMLVEKTVGEIHSVNLEYLLDTSHGADYFRRWHSDRAQSGGLFVHKSTHHFDLVNWWLDALPQQVFALGDLAFYGRDNALRRGDAALTSYERYTGNAAARSDPFNLDLSSTESFRRLYLAAEKDSGYIRDQNVFRPGINICDQMSALVRYRNGPSLTYSLVAYSPREGMRVALNGDRGRIEYNEFVGSHMNRAATTDDFRHEDHGSCEAQGEWIQVYPHFAPSYRIDLPPNKGPHGGADDAMYRQLFAPAAEPDSWHRDAGHEQGAASILIGIAANQSIATGLPVEIASLFPLRPDARRLSDLT